MPRTAAAIKSSLRRIVCTGCGKRAPEAGFIVPALAIEEGCDSDGYMTVAIDDDAAHPLCEACLVVMEDKEDVEVLGVER